MDVDDIRTRNAAQAEGYWKRATDWLLDQIRRNEGAYDLLFETHQREMARLQAELAAARADNAVLQRVVNAAALLEGLDKILGWDNDRRELQQALKALDATRRAGE